MVAVPFSYNVLVQGTEVTVNDFSWLLFATLMILYLSNWKARIIFFTFLLAYTLSFPRLSPIKFPDQVSSNLIYVVLLSALYVNAAVYVYLKGRAIMQDDLDHEIEWQLQNAKLAEISSMTRTMHSLISLPLKAFSDECSDLRRHAASWNDEILLEKMQHQIDELVRISQSYSWMYRAFRNEGDYSASSDVLVMQLQTLSKLSFKEGGWEWKSKPKTESIEISGPIPSLMLLLFCIIIQIVEDTPSQGLNFIELDVNRTDRGVNWIFTWPMEDENQKPVLDGTGEDALSLGAMRRDLIQDLQEACHAKLLEYERDGSRVLQVSGAWSRGMAFATSLA